MSGWAIVYIVNCAKKKLKFEHENKWYMNNSAAVLENEAHKLLWDFDIQTDHLISARRPDLIIIKNKKERTTRIVDFAVPADRRVKLKESKTKYKYLDFTRELNKLWNMKETIVSIVISGLATVTKGLIQGVDDLKIRRRVETIKTTALFWSARIMKRVLETCGDLLSLKLQRETIC